MRRVKDLLGGALQAALLLAAGLLVALLALPPLALVLRVSPRTLLARFAEPAVLEAMRLSLVTSLIATLLAAMLGLPLAYRLVTRRLPGQRLIETLVDLPMVLPPTVAGAGMCWARALGEFGATITFAGNLPGVTRTLPLAVYTALQSDLDAAVTLAVALLAVSFVVLLGLRLLPAGMASGRTRAPRRAG